MNRILFYTIIFAVILILTGTLIIMKCYLTCLCWATLQVVGSVDYSTYVEVQRFQEYLQINTTTHNDLTPAIDFWQTLADEQGVPLTVVELVSNYPIVILKWAGSNSSLQSIMLNSHMDVVPADEAEGWTYPPFSGYLTGDGEIWGRGTQDMKSVSIQYYEALSRIKNQGITLLRDVYMTLMPDEEVGAESGMLPFLQSSEFLALNVGIELDEGSPFPVPFIPLFYQDKVVWQIQVDCYGVAAHGSTFSAANDTATGKCRNFLDLIMEFREEQYEVSLVAESPGSYTSVNLNILNGGTANNVIPSHVKFVFDMRLGIDVNEAEFAAMLQGWIDASGDNITLSYISRNAQSPATIISSTNPYWVSLNSVFTDLNLTIFPIVSPGSTDARHVRNAGYPAFGFSPMPDTPLLLHSVDERLHASTFLDGIDIYEEMIKALANIPADAVATDPSTYLLSTVTSD